MSRRGSETRQKQEQVLLRVEPGFRDQMKKGAWTSGLTVQSWLRKLAADALGVEPGKLTKRRRKPKVISEEKRQLVPLLDEAARLRGEVGKLGGALVKAAMHTREIEAMESHAEIERLIPEIKNLVDDLQGLRERLREALDG